MDELILKAFISEIEKLSSTHGEIMKKMQEGSKDTGEPNVKSPVAETAKKFDPKVIKEQLKMVEGQK